jgi:cytochrome c5
MHYGQALAAGAALLLSTALLAGDPAYRHFPGEHLAQGRVIWLGTCEGCHGYGTAGAPIPMQPAEWRERLEKDREVLYRHAIEGFFGPEYTYMPPRGGNDSLSDREVRLAVDYMTTLATHYLQSEEPSP